MCILISITIYYKKKKVHNIVLIIIIGIFYEFMLTKTIEIYVNALCSYLTTKNLSIHKWNFDLQKIILKKYYSFKINS